MTGHERNPSLRQIIPGKMEKQTAFGWLIALAIFFGGAGGGIFLVGYLTNLLYGSALSKVGMILGPPIAIACTVCLFADLGNRLGTERLFLVPSRLSTSWISRGAWALAFFIVVGLAYASGLPWPGASGLVGILAALSALVVLLYTGFLLGVVKGIPFWNNSLLPVLFITSGLGCGAAILLLIAAFFPADQAMLKSLTGMEILVIVAQLIMLWAYLGVASHRDIASAESVRLIKAPISFIIVLGLILPLIILAGSMTSALSGATVVYHAAAGIIELIGAFFLRLSILNSGVYLRLGVQ